MTFSKKYEIIIRPKLYLIIMTPIDDTPYRFELLSEDGKGLGVFIDVISSRSKTVTETLKTQILTHHRINAFREIDEQFDGYNLVSDELAIEIKSAVARIVAWEGFEEECTYENRLLLCSTNPFVRKQVIYHSERISDFLDECTLQLVSYAQNELKLSEKQKDGSTLREQLESIQKQAKFTPKELEPVEVNPVIMYLWEIFLHLNSSRQSGMGINGISYLEIKAWCELTGETLSPYELKIIKMLDREFVSFYNKSSEKESSTK